MSKTAKVMKSLFAIAKQLNLVANEDVNIITIMKVMQYLIKLLSFCVVISTKLHQREGKKQFV